MLTVSHRQQPSAHRRGFRPAQFVFAGSLSGFLNPSHGMWPTLIGLAMKDAGGRNAVFNFPANGTHGWGYWGAQLQAMKPEPLKVVGAGVPPVAQWSG